MLTIKPGYLYSHEDERCEVFLVRRILDVATGGIVVDGLWFDAIDMQTPIWKEQLFIKVSEGLKWKELKKWSPSVINLVA